MKNEKYMLIIICEAVGTILFGVNLLYMVYINTHSPAAWLNKWRRLRRTF